MNLANQAGQSCAKTYGTARYDPPQMIWIAETASARTKGLIFRSCVETCSKGSIKQLNKVTDIKEKDKIEAKTRKIKHQMESVEKSIKSKSNQSKPGNPSLNIQNELDNHELFINELIQQKLQNENAQLFSAIAITLDLPTMEPEDFLRIGDEHLDTILETESDEFIKSSVENLVPSPSEFEDECECDGIDEADYDPEEEIRLIEKLLYDNSSPRPPEEFNSENSDAIIEYFSPSPIPVKDSDPFM
uniref:Reverse transcriptase domain-containing protein n=1 Tax=Tanacetum cinerariifolium TaxID=118510 RepID=A0A6L2JCY9_TANCI|nr:hypothetical protein [Tanacetum cinerariifolium]